MADSAISELPLPDLDGFTHRWPEVDGVWLHAVEGGQPNGPVDVLVARFSPTTRAWRRAVPALRRRFRVIAIDLPGQGHSDRPHGSYDTPPVAARIQAAVSELGV